ncbi:hypothetical protein GCM10009673_23800 [Nesterenkonia sandarakina]
MIRIIPSTSWEAESPAAGSSILLIPADYCAAGQDPNASARGSAPDRDAGAHTPVTSQAGAEKLIWYGSC